MTGEALKIIWFIQNSLAEGKEADKDGFYVYTKQELCDGSGVSASTLVRDIPDVVEFFANYVPGWMPNSNDMIQMVSDVSYERGKFKLRRNPDAMAPDLDYYWAMHPLHPRFAKDYFDDKHRRRHNSPDEIVYGSIPWDWSEEKIQEELKKYEAGPHSEVKKYIYEGDKKISPEQQRIDAIKANGGRHLQNFKKENITLNMCLAAVENDGEALKFVPKDLLCKEIYETAVKTTGSVLGKVPEEFITEEMCLNAVTSDGLAIEYVPDRFKTRDLYLLAASQNPLVFQKMPEELITVEFVVEVINKYEKGTEAVASLPKAFKNARFYLPLVEACPEVIWKLPKTAHTAAISKACLKAMGFKSLAEAVKNNPEFLSQVHPSLYDHDACMEFVTSSFFTEGVNKSDSWGNCWGFNTEADREKGLLYLNRKYDEVYSVQDMEKWTDVCLALVSNNPVFISYVKPEMVTQEMCEIAVTESKTGTIIDEIPLKFRTKELCRAAFEKSEYNIKYLPEEFLSEEICLEAVNKSGFLLENLPEQFKTYSVCLAALMTEGQMIEFVPEKVMDKKLCLTAFEHDRYKFSALLKYVPKEIMDYDICLAAVKHYADDIEFVPNEYLTYELCLENAKGDGYTVDTRIPKDFYTEEFCLALVDKSDSKFKYIPKDKLTEKICLKAISNCSRYVSILKEIPEELITQKMCDEAIKRSTLLLYEVPEKFITEEILLSVAEQTPGTINDSNFPKRLRTKEFIEKLIKTNPWIEQHLKYLNISPLD